MQINTKLNFLLMTNHFYPDGTGLTLREHEDSLNALMGIK